MTGEAGARTKGETERERVFSKTSLRNQHFRPTMTSSYSAFPGLSRKSVPSRRSRAWEAWGTGARRTGQGEGGARVRGPDTVGPWDFVFYSKL